MRRYSEPLQCDRHKGVDSEALGKEYDQRIGQRPPLRKGTLLTSGEGQYVFSYVSSHIVLLTFDSG